MIKGAWLAFGRGKMLVVQIQFGDIYFHLNSSLPSRSSQLVDACKNEIKHDIHP